MEAPCEAYAGKPGSRPRPRLPRAAERLDDRVNTLLAFSSEHGISFEEGSLVIHMHAIHTELRL